MSSVPRLVRALPLSCRELAPVAVNGPSHVLPPLPGKIASGRTSRGCHAALTLPGSITNKGLSKKLFPGARLAARLERAGHDVPYLVLQNAPPQYSRIPVLPEQVRGLVDGAQFFITLQHASDAQTATFAIAAEPDAYVSTVVGTVEQDGDAFYVKASSARAPLARLRLDASAAPLVGRCVLADISDPTAAEPLARVIETLPPATTLRSRIFAIAADQGARFGFSEAVRQEIACLRALPPERGVDFTDIDFVTIDNFSTQVMDQAMHLQRNGDGYILHYAIADAARLIPMGGAIDVEACLRGASIYLPCDPPSSLGESVSVTPAEIAVGMGSLVPDADRLAFVATVHLDASGRVTDHSFARGTIRSRAKLAFSQVQELHDGTGCQHLAATPYGESLQLLKEVGTQLKARAIERGILNLGNDEPRLMVAEGTDSEVVVSQRSECAVEEFNAHVSILINALVGTTLSENHLPGLWRVQAPMEGESEERLHQSLGALGRPWHAGESLQNYLSRLEPTDLRTQVARYLVLRHTQGASFSPHASGHFALALDRYSQFTAPMRRYPDVVVHNVLRAHCEGLPMPYTDAAGQEWLQRTADNAAKHRSREGRILRHVDTLLLAASLQGATHGAMPRLRGTVMGTFRERTVVQLENPPVRIETPRAPGAHPGQQVTVRVQQISVDEPRVDAVIESSGKKHKSKSPTRQGHRRHAA